MTLFPIIPHKESQTIPMFMLQDVLGSTKEINMFRIYLYINACSNGCVYLPKTVINQISNDLKVSQKTVKRKLLKLNERNWINQDKKTDRYYVRGIREIKKRKGEKSRQGFIVDIKIDLQDEEKFKALICAAFINNLGRYKIYQTYIKKQRGRDKEWLKGRSAPTSQPRRLLWWPVAANYIAKILGISISTAHEYRKLAEKHGFIEVRRYRREISELELMERKEKGGKDFAMIRRQGKRLVVDGPHWIRSEVIHYRRIPRNKAKRNRNHSSSLSNSINSSLSFPSLNLIPFLE